MPDYAALLGDQASRLLDHKCSTLSAAQLHLQGPDFIDRVLLDTDRPVTVLRNLGSMYGHGRLAGTGYTSI